MVKTLKSEYLRRIIRKNKKVIFKLLSFAHEVKRSLVGSCLVAQLTQTGSDWLALQRLVEEN